MALRCLVLFAFLLCATRGFAQGAFGQSIAPILLDHCIDCHSGLKPKGGLDLTTKAKAFEGGDSGPAFTAGKIEQSLAWKRVEAGEMPPKSKLTSAEKAALRTWIETGAVWDADPLDPFRATTSKRAGANWWALQPIKASLPPDPRTNNPIDAFVRRRLKENGLTLSPRASRATLIRRVAFDLLGLPPTPAEVDAYVSDPDPRAYEKRVERFLNDPRHGERWARHWLDVVRFGESHGFEHDEIRPHSWPYRDWVIAALNRDLPYDQFARMQIAGDLLDVDEGVAATGFLVAGGYDSVGQAQQSAAMKAVVRQDELEDLVATVSQTFLGLTVHCARCHDHKFDPIRQEEYYRMTAALAGVRHGVRVVDDKNSRTERDRRQKEIASLLAERDAIDEPVRNAILAKRDGAAKIAPPPRPVARWDFVKGTNDELGSLDMKLFGNVKRTSAGLELAGGDSYAASSPLGRAIASRTLIGVVKLDDLQQRGGAVLTIQSLDGADFDAIVFGEREVHHWMAGSNNFIRTRSFGGEAEADSGRPVHFAIVYHEDGTIRGYRNGQPYGKPYRSKALKVFEAGKSQLVVGMRHSPAGGNRHLKGIVVRAELHDRALTSDEVAACAGVATQTVTDRELVDRLSPETRQRRTLLNARIDALRKPPAITAKKVYAVMPRTPEECYVLIRGEPGQRGAKVTPGGIAAVSGLSADFGIKGDASDADRRRKLADWIASDKNSLFARVLVNRLWHYHFGVGLVETPSDFGFNGGRPSHPELLDWLAAEFIKSGWSMKHMHRLIVTSDVYCQMSRGNERAAKVDVGNRFLWRKSPQRLDAEAVRDTMLVVAGQLNPAMGGPGYRDFTITVRGATHYYHPRDDDGPDLLRRSIYRTWARGGRNGLLDTLDCPDPSTATPRRAVTTTPLQALSLLNNAFVLRMADRFADRLKREAGVGAAAQVNLAYRLAYGRSPNGEESRLLVDAISRHGLAVVCRAIFNSNEFVFVD